MLRDTQQFPMGDNFAPLLRRGTVNKSLGVNTIAGIEPELLLAKPMPSPVFWRCDRVGGDDKLPRRAAGASGHADTSQAFSLVLLLLPPSS